LTLKLSIPYTLGRGFELLTAQRKKFFAWYEASVVDAPQDVALFRSIFFRVFGEYPETYREDFCGTFQHSVEWIKLNRRNRAWALDLDPRTLAYGIETHLSTLQPQQQSRITLFQRDVRSILKPKVDFATALNFSYSLFKTRSELVSYFRKVYASLNSRGLFLLDVMGGSALHEPSKDERRIPKTKKTPALDYFWEQKTFDPISNHAKFAIHFRLKGKRKIYRNAFTYDWRLWSLPELQEIMREAGFAEAKIFWEGSSRNGQGNGIFRERVRGEACDVWLAYVVGVKGKSKGGASK
jgi:hypothetical protein